MEKNKFSDKVNEIVRNYSPRKIAYVIVFVLLFLVLMVSIGFEGAIGGVVAAAVWNFLGPKTINYVQSYVENYRDRDEDK